jgi:arsenate reductase
MLLFVCYPRCSTCKSARAWLDERGIEYAFRDIRSDNPNAGEIKAWLNISGLPLKKFFNTSGNSYKALGLSEKLPHLSEADQIALLASDGLLVKRPLLVSDDFALVGFKPDEWSKHLKA